MNTFFRFKEYSSIVIHYDHFKESIKINGAYAQCGFLVDNIPGILDKNTFSLLKEEFV